MSPDLKGFAVAFAPTPYFRPWRLDDVDYKVRNVSQPSRVLLELSCAPQASHGVLIVFGAKVALRAVFIDDERKCDTHDCGRNTSTGCPIVGYSIRAVEFVPKSVRVNR